MGTAKLPKVGFAKEGLHLLGSAEIAWLVRPARGRVAASPSPALPKPKILDAKVQQKTKVGLQKSGFLKPLNSKAPQSQIPRDVLPELKLVPPDRGSPACIGVQFPRFHLVTQSP